MYVILGNIVSLIACTTMVLIGFIKHREKIILAQVLQFSLMAISNFLLGGIGGTIANFISIVRNLICAKGHCNKGLKIALIAVQIALSLGTLSLNPITWLPIIANGMFTWYIDTENIIWFKWVMMITLGMWVVYDLSHLNYVSVCFDIFTIISTGFSVFKIRREQRAA